MLSLHERAKCIWLWGLPNSHGKITQESNENDTESEDEILAEMQKEYEAEDSVSKDIQNPQLAKLLGKLFRSRLLDKVLKDKFERQDRPENCETAKPTCPWLRKKG